MTNLADINRRCLELLAELPKQRFAFYPAGATQGSSPTPSELYAKLWAMNLADRERIDVLCRRLTLDWQVLNEEPATWFQVEQRIRAAVYFCERTCGTLETGETLALSADTPDEALEWALVRLWRFAGPLWLAHAARLIAAGMDLSSRELPPPA